MKTGRLFLLLLLDGLFTGSCLWAQQTKQPLPAASPLTAAKPATASLEERIAAARSVKVMDSILGIKLGSELDEAHEKLDPLSAPGKPPKSEGAEEEEKARDVGEKPSEVTKTSRVPDRNVKPGADEDEGHKVLWQLASTDYSAVYIMADDEEHITSVTGILRPGKEMPFDKVGEVAKAPVHDDHAVVWDVLRPDRPLCRVLAKGADGRASTLTLFVARRKSSAALPHLTKSAGSNAD